MNESLVRSFRWRKCVRLEGEKPNRQRLYKPPTTEKKVSESVLAPHVLRAIPVTGGTKFLLIIKKAKHEQVLQLIVQITPEDFGAAWNVNGWHEVDHVPGKDFFAIRFVKVKGGFIVWRVHHVDGVPFDLFDYFVGTEAEMRRFYAFH